MNNTVHLKFIISYNNIKKNYLFEASNPDNAAPVNVANQHRQNIILIKIIAPTEIFYKYYYLLPFKFFLGLISNFFRIERERAKNAEIVTLIKIFVGS